MDAELLLKLLGFGMALFGLIGGIILRDRQVMTKIEAGDSKCHTRINQAKDDFTTKLDVVKKEYVRRDAILSELADVKTNQNYTNNRIDQIILALNTDKKS